MCEPQLELAMRFTVSQRGHLAAYHLSESESRFCFVFCEELRTKIDILLPAENYDSVTTHGSHWDKFLRDTCHQQDADFSYRKLAVGFRIYSG